MRGSYVTPPKAISCGCGSGLPPPVVQLRPTTRRTQDADDVLPVAELEVVAVDLDLSRFDVAAVAAVLALAIDPA